MQTAPDDIPANFLRHYPQYKNGAFNLMTAQREVNVLTDCETFIYVFRLAARMMIDVLTEGQMKEI